MQLKKIPCPTCGYELSTLMTRGRTRRRRCLEGHIHFTFDNEIISKRHFAKAETALRHGVAVQDLETLNKMVLGDPRAYDDEEEAEALEALIPAPDTKTGHYVSEPEEGRYVYTMKW